MQQQIESESAIEEIGRTLVVVLPESLLVQFSLLHCVVEVMPLPTSSLFLVRYLRNKGPCPLTDLLHAAFRKLVVMDENAEAPTPNS